MANKLSLLKKQLITNSVVILVIAVALTGSALMLSNYDDDATTEQHSKEGENSQVRSQSVALQEELGASLETGNYYDSYINNHNSDFSLKRESATQWLTDYREKYHITNLSVTIAPVTDMKVEGLQLKTGDMVKSEVHLTFSALTDNSVYNFIEGMQRQFPGITVFNEIKIIRDADMSRSVLMELSQHKITPLVKADVTFQWLGIRQVSDKKSDTSNGFVNGR